MARVKVLVKKPDYGVDAPAVLRNLFLFGGLCLLASLLLPNQFQLGSLIFKLTPMFFWTGVCLTGEGFLYLLYVKKGKHRHRDHILSLHPWRGNEQVLDVGCGRGLLLAGAAKRLTTGKATGIDLWSNVDMAANTPEATLHNLKIEGVRDRCVVLAGAAQSMVFPDRSFDVVVSNLCLHNIYDPALRHEALAEIARVLRPGGVALLSDYKHTRDYARKLARMGLIAERRRGNLLATFPPLPIVIARKP
jgi:SAM-dependent methyltransferase